MQDNSNPERRYGVLEYQAKPSLCDVAHDRVRVHLVIDQPQTWASCVVRQGRRHGPSITFKITPCWVTLLQPARRAAVLGRPSSLRHQCLSPPVKEAACGHRSSDDRKSLITPTHQVRFSYRWSAFRSPRSMRPRRSPWPHTGKRDSPRPSGRQRRPCPPGNSDFHKSRTS